MKRVKRYGRYKKSKSSKKYYRLPLLALVIFWAVWLLGEVGISDKVDDYFKGLAENETVVGALLSLVFPQGEDNPPLEEGDHSEMTIDEPMLRDLPWTGVLDSALPALDDESAAPPEKITIDGSSSSAYVGSGTVYMRNDSKYTVNIEDYVGKKNEVKLAGNGAQVLIVHTHGTEAYTPGIHTMYEASDPDRTTDIQYNVVRVGDEIARILEDNGIKTIHSQKLHDSPAYNGSYSRSLDDITQQLKDNPSIKVIIDVHRDAVTSVNGKKYKTVASIDGKDAAQLMFVTGTDGGGLKHPDWKKNLTFQVMLQDRLNSTYPGLMRPLNIRDGRFNQHVSTGSMLLEVGTNGNTLDEAIYSAQLFAQVLADVLNSTK